jgi:hypothetical protein
MWTPCIYMLSYFILYFKNIYPLLWQTICHRVCAVWVSICVSFLSNSLLWQLEGGSHSDP